MVYKNPNILATKVLVFEYLKGRDEYKEPIFALFNKIKWKREMLKEILSLLNYFDTFNQ